MKKGDYIYHQKYEAGEVTEVHLDNNGNLALIMAKFKIGQKRLMLQYALLREPTREELEVYLNSISNQKKVDDDFFEQISNDVKKNLSEKEFREIEESLEVKLPLFYKDFLENFPAKIIAFKRDKCIANEKLNERYLRNSVKSIVQINQYFESFELKKLFAIGDNGAGLYYVIQLDNNSKQVYNITTDGYYDRQVKKYIQLNDENFGKYIEVEANSLTDFSNKVIQDSIRIYKMK